MKIQKSSISKVLTWFAFLLVIFILLFLFLMKDNMNNYISSEIKSQSGTELQSTASFLVDSLYNYQDNGRSYELTFIEFGAKGCVACRKMETVMEEIKNEYPQTVQVVFMNILEMENQNLMKYYGIAAIPTQVLLDSKGLEYFRHTGYISFSELKQQFNFPSQ